MFKVLTTIIGFYLYSKQEQIMAKIEQFQKELSEAQSGLDNIQQDYDQLQAEVADLKAQIEASGLTGAEEDALLSTVASINAKVQALAGQVVAPEPEPEVPVEPQPEPPVEEPEIPEEEA